MAKLLSIKSEELVPGDTLIVEEGNSIAADGKIIHANDFSVNESILTGESLAVYKDQDSPDNLIFSGTTVASGLAIATVTATGSATQLGKIGKSLESIKEQKTPLEIQIGNFVKKMVIAGALIFLIVWGINYSNTPEPDYQPINGTYPGHEYFTGRNTSSLHHFYGYGGLEIDEKWRHRKTNENGGNFRQCHSDLYRQNRHHYGEQNEPCESIPGS